MDIETVMELYAGRCPDPAWWWWPEVAEQDRRPPPESAVLLHDLRTAIDVVMACSPVIIRVPLSVPGPGTAQFWRAWLAAWLRIGGAVPLPVHRDRERLRHILHHEVRQQELREAAGT